jgi:tetratricopeptide (TPR) repeat protein
VTPGLSRPVSAEHFSVAAGGDIKGPVNIGIPSSELPGIIKAATKDLKDLTAKQRRDLKLLRAQLEVSASALRSFLLAIGEADMPVEQQPAKLAEIATRHKDLLARLEATSSTDPEVQRLKAEARAALDAGDFGRAEELLNRAKARDLLVIEQMRATMERLQAALDARQLSAAEAAGANGDLMMTQIRYAEAARYYAEAVGLTPEKYAEQLSERLTDWVGAAWRAGDYPSALDAARRVLALDEARLPADDARLGSRLNNLAVLYQATGRYAEAEPLHERALAIVEKALGPEHPNVATTADNLALLYRDTGRYGEAEPLFERAIAIGEKTLGPEHPDLATRLNNLALLYRATGRYGEAEPLFERAIAIGEKVYGPDHPEVAIDLWNLAALYVATECYAEAEPLYRRTLAIFGATLPADHPNIAAALEHMASLLNRLGRGEEAAALWSQATAIRQQRELGRQLPPL